MPDDHDPSEGRIEDKTIQRSPTWALKSRLMRRAFDGQSRHTPAQMILLIQWRLSANAISAQHRQLLEAINPFNLEDQPRSVMMLDRLAQEADPDQIIIRRFEYNPANVPAPQMLQ